MRFGDVDDLARYLPADQPLPADRSLVRGIGAGELLPAGALGSPGQSGVLQVPIRVPVDGVPASVEVGSRVDVYVSDETRGGPSRRPPARRCRRDGRAELGRLSRRRRTPAARAGRPPGRTRATTRRSPGSSPRRRSAPSPSSDAGSRAWPRRSASWWSPPAPRGSPGRSPRWAHAPVCSCSSGASTSTTCSPRRPRGRRTSPWWPSTRRAWTRRPSSTCAGIRCAPSPSSPAAPPRPTGAGCAPIGSGSRRWSPRAISPPSAQVVGDERPEVVAAPLEQTPLDDEPPEAEPGRVVVVWGPQGAPGRTTVAAGLAGVLAARGAETVLVDADPYGGAVAQHLGSPRRGLGSAVRGPARRGRGPGRAARQHPPLARSPAERRDGPASSRPVDRGAGRSRRAPGRGAPRARPRRRRHRLLPGGGPGH